MQPITTSKALVASLVELAAKIRGEAWSEAALWSGLSLWLSKPGAGPDALAADDLLPATCGRKGRKGKEGPAARIASCLRELSGLLRGADKDAILRDFAALRPAEDPSIHLHEMFLEKHDPLGRLRRGVFNTPRPVVVFILRSLDALLRKHFALRDGLADTATWEDLRGRFHGLEPPPGARRDDPFVRILDPACGTGAFLIEAVGILHETMISRWAAEGRSPQERERLWNEYVPRHLLPRLAGFEILPAPWAIARTGLRLELEATGYHLSSSDELRVELSSALEWASARDPAPPFTAPPFTVIVGNPPYSNFGVLKKNSWMAGLLRDYKTDIYEKKWNLDDLCIQFLRLAQWAIASSGAGVAGMITSNTYLDGVTHRGMRRSLLGAFDWIHILDLHGSAQRGERCSDGRRDENIFDIRQGVAVSCFVRCPGSPGGARVFHRDLRGPRASKGARLLERDITRMGSRRLAPRPDGFFFVPGGEGDLREYEGFWSLSRVFEVHGAGLATDRDGLFYDHDRARLAERMKIFFSPKGLKPAFASRYRVRDSSSYRILSRRARTRFDEGRIARCLYRPFDFRWVYYDPRLTSRPAQEVMRHARGNLLLLATRQVSTGDFRHAFVARDVLVDRDPLSLATRERTRVFPLYLHAGPGEPPLPNLADDFIEALASGLGLSFVARGSGDLKRTFGPEDVLAYAYALLYSPGYRRRYREPLQKDFPRIPLCRDRRLFAELCAQGGALVGLHSPGRGDPRGPGRGPRRSGSPAPRARLLWKGTGPAEVRPGHPRFQDGRVYLSPRRWAEGVPEEAWRFVLGGYRVCEKWLEDRRGREISRAELEAFAGIVAAARETLRRMERIDEIISERGGWPAAFEGGTDTGVRRPGTSAPPG